MTKRNPSICAIIPARFGSSRLPGKPLIDFHGKTMIRHVYERVADVISDVSVATDDERIADEVRSFGGSVIMTTDQHLNGTSRVAEAMENLGWKKDYVINVQGDEPLLSRENLTSLIEGISNGRAQIATLVAEHLSLDIGHRKDEVYVVRDLQDQALYFSRARIPALHSSVTKKDLQAFRWYTHIGLYAFQTSLLPELVALKSSYLEKAESLEQNRWLENGYRIQTILAKSTGIPVDLPEDVEKVRILMSEIISS